MLPPEAQCARLDRLFDQLLDAAASERAAQLSALQLREPALHQQLVHMLELAQNPDPALDPERLDRRAAWQVLGSGPEQRPALGERIGAWRLVRHLGRGGMGDVYEVARADGVYAQQAALKLILSDIDARQFLERFARERQILALLSHPGIARLLDGGEDARGRPFLVMELVAGTSIDAHCAAQRLDLRARLQLFLQVAAAVEHAHRQRVVHRDIKPSNIIVTAQGETKLLDFGIAKVLCEDQARPGTTRTALLLTPQYSTPEQVSGQPVDGRSDIYQLGLLLFELLTAQRAQEPIDGTPHALLQAVCVEDRAPPSACAARGSATVCAQVGDLKPAALARQLRGDLDWIVLKALRQDPQRRYASVQALSDDVQCYLHGAPVRARPETFVYRAQKLVRRHPWGVTSTAAAFALLAAGALTMTYLYRVNATEARTSQQVTQLMLKMFETAKPEQALGRELTARQLLDMSWPLIESEAADQPQVQVRLFSTLGETYRLLGAYPQALAQLTRAQQLIKAHPQLPKELQAVTLRNLGRLLTNQADYAAAEQALRRARQLLAQRYGAVHVEAAEILKDLGQLEHNRGRYVRAVELYAQALTVYAQIGGDHELARADCQERLAVSNLALGKYAESAQLLEDALQVQRKVLPKGHPNIAGSMANLAEVRQRQGYAAQAEALYRQALDSMQRSRGVEHPYVATIMNNLARTLMDQQQFDEAQTLLEGALAIRRAALDPHHESIAMSLSDLGGLHDSRGHTLQAEDYYRKALDMLGADHPWRGVIMINVGRACEARGAFAEAEQLYRDSLKLNRRHFGADHDVLGTSLQRLGTLLYEQGRTHESEAPLHEALRIFRKQLPASHPNIASVSQLLDRIATQRSQQQVADR